MAATKQVQLTLLNGMAGADFDLALDRHVELGLKWLDLKDGLYGQTINDLSVENAERAAVGIQARGLEVYCLSTGLCFSNVAEGEVAFRERHFATLEKVLAIAPILKPKVIRLLAAQLSPTPVGESVVAVVCREYPWVLEVYREMVDRITTAGFSVLIENEVEDCIFATPDDILTFFAALNRPDKARLIWDVQNLWQMRVPPTRKVYRSLRPLMGGFHLKGGRSEEGSDALVWASGLEEASWPVREIVGVVITDGVVPVICLNPSHGKKPEGYRVWDTVQRDIAFLRNNFSEVE